MKRPGIIAAAYIALTIVVVSPLVDFRHLSTASYEGDARLIIWTLAWDAHALLTGAPLFEANIYFPEAQSLRYAEHHLGIGIFAVPLYAATANPVVAYWILWLLAFPLNALAMYALARHVTGDDLAAFAAGCIYAFCFFRMHHAHGHLQLIWTWALPLVPLALRRWIDTPTPATTTLVTAIIVVTAMTSWYLAVFVALFVLVSLACLLPGRAITITHVWQGAVGSIIGIAVLVRLARPYFGLVAGPVAEAAANAADLRSYVLPPANTWLGQILLRQTSIEPRWIWGEQTLYVGIAVGVLCLAGVKQLLAHESDFSGDRRLVASILITGGLAMALSFGPTPTGWSPFDLLSRLPGLSLLRAPARFALLVMMAAALLAALGVVWLRRRSERRAPVIVGALLVLFFVESFVVGFPAGKPKPISTPKPYEMLATLPRGAVLSLPTYRATAEAFREADYLLFSTRHWHSIVNGFGRQEPPRHGGRLSVLSTFPSPQAIEMMRQLGVRYVVMHTRRARDLTPRAERARREAAVVLLDSTDGDFLFELR